MQVVDHEDDGRIERFEIRDEAAHRTFAVELRCRRELLHQSVPPDRGAQSFDDREPEMLGVAFVAFHLHPGRARTQARRTDP
jgi:hypothetical protein